MLYRRGDFVRGDFVRTPVGGDLIYTCTSCQPTTQTTVDWQAGVDELIYSIQWSWADN